MPSYNERKAWEAFDGYIKDARAAMDGCVPLVLIALPIMSHQGIEGVNIDLHGVPRMIWPGTKDAISNEIKVQFFKHIADMYEKGFAQEGP